MPKVTQLLIVGLSQVLDCDDSGGQPLWQGHCHGPLSPPPFYTLPSSALLTGGQGGQGAATSFFSGLLFFSAMAHSPFCTALNSMGFRSPYSPEATSMTGGHRGKCSAQIYPSFPRASRPHLGCVGKAGDSEPPSLTLSSHPSPCQQGLTH